MLDFEEGAEGGLEGHCGCVRGFLVRVSIQDWTIALVGHTGLYN